MFHGSSWKLDPHYLVKWNYSEFRVNYRYNDVIHGRDSKFALMTNECDLRNGAHWNCMPHVAYPITDKMQWLIHFRT